MARGGALLIGGAVLVGVATLSIWALDELPAPAPPPAIKAPAGMAEIIAPSVGERTPSATAVDPVASPMLDVVRIEQDGAAVFAGTAQPDADVEVRIGEAVIATARAGGDGAFVAYGKTPAAETVQRIDLWQTDRAGVATRSDAPALVAPPRADPQIVTSDTAPDVVATAPPEPRMVVQAQPEGVRVLQAAPRSAEHPVTLDLVSYSDDGWLEISGRAQALRMLRVYADAKLIAETWVAADGRWSTRAVAGLAPGNYTLRVDMLGEDGGVRGRVETPFRREAGAPAALAAGEIVVQPGDTLWAMAEDRYGEGVRYSVIYQANAARIRDPDLIYPGQVFKLPDPGAPR